MYSFSKVHIQNDKVYLIFYSNYYVFTYLYIIEVISHISISWKKYYSLSISKLNFEIIALEA